MFKILIVEFLQNITNRFSCGMHSLSISYMYVLQRDFIPSFSICVCVCVNISENSCVTSTGETATEHNTNSNYSYFDRIFPFGKVSGTTLFRFLRTSCNFIAYLLYLEILAPETLQTK